jgi:DNA-binding beta-propeller fold protein YncE
MRGGIAAAALFAIAGCSGMTSQSPSLGSPSSSATVHQGVPFVPGFHHNGTFAGPEASYPTKKSLVFVADQAQAAVSIYKTKALPSNPAAIATIHVAAGCPYGMTTDKKGTLYVVDNCGGNDVEEYAKSSTTLKTTITSGISNPLGVVIDKNGTLYVSNYPASIQEYANGSTTPTKTITGGGMADPFGLALDSAGNLYIADFGASAVFELPAGGSSVTNLNLQSLGEPLGLAVDLKNGLLWETGGANKVVNVYKLGGSTSPINSITSGLADPYAISLENVGQPKGTVVLSDLYDRNNGADGSVFAFKAGQYTPYATLTNNVVLPTGILITKP